MCDDISGSAYMAVLHVDTSIYGFIVPLSGAA